MEPKARSRQAPGARCGGIFAIAASLLTFAGCSDMVCTTELRSVIVLDILDSLTRAPAAAGATVWLRGPYSDSITVSDVYTASLAHIWFEDLVKPGVYSVEVERAGYRGWSRSNIQVKADACHVTTHEQLTALLQR